MPPNENETDVTVARLSERIEGLTGRVDRMCVEVHDINVTVGKIQSHCAAQQQSSVSQARKELTCDKWHNKVDGELSTLMRGCAVDQQWCEKVSDRLTSLEITRTEMNSSTKTVLTVVSFLASILTLSMMMYSASLARETAAHIRARDAVVQQVK